MGHHTLYGHTCESHLKVGESANVVTANLSEAGAVRHTGSEAPEAAKQRDSSRLADKNTSSTDLPPSVRTRGSLRAKSNLRCAFCAAVFSAKSLRDSHARMNHPEEVADFWFGCNICSFHLPDLESFQEHVKEHKRLKGSLLTGKLTFIANAALAEDRTSDPQPSTSRGPQNSAAGVSHPRSSHEKTPG